MSDGMSSAVFTEPSVELRRRRYVSPRHEAPSTPHVPGARRFANSAEQRSEGIHHAASRVQGGVAQQAGTRSSRVGSLSLMRKNAPAVSVESWHMYMKQEGRPEKVALKSEVLVGSAPETTQPGGPQTTGGAAVVWPLASPSRAAATAPRRAKLRRPEACVRRECRASRLVGELLRAMGRQQVGRAARKDLTWRWPVLQCTLLEPGPPVHGRSRRAGRQLSAERTSVSHRLKKTSAKNKRRSCLKMLRDTLTRQQGTQCAARSTVDPFLSAPAMRRRMHIPASPARLRDAARRKGRRRRRWTVNEHSGGPTGESRRRMRLMLPCNAKCGSMRSKTALEAGGPMGEGEFIPCR